MTTDKMSKFFLLLFFGCMLRASAKLFTAETAAAHSTDSYMHKAMEWGKYIMLSKASTLALKLLGAYRAMEWVYRFLEYILTKDNLSVKDVITYIWENPPTAVVRFIADRVIPLDSIWKTIDCIVQKSEWFYRFFKYIFTKDNLSVKDIITYIWEDPPTAVLSIIMEDHPKIW